MEILEYIKKFRLDQPNFEFNREEFVEALGKDFEACLNNPNICGEKPTYDKFKVIIKTFEVKFKAISDLKPGRPLSKGIWNAFYALWVIPIRGKLYPDLNQKILDRIKLRSQNNILCPARQHQRR